MFIPIDVLFHTNKDDNFRHTERWMNKEGDSARNTIIQSFKNGAGKNCLEKTYQDLPGGLMKDQFDLKGIGVSNEKFIFKDRTDQTQLSEDDITFYQIKFDYSVLSDITFQNARFVNCSFDFARIENCKFDGCIFEKNNFYSTELLHNEFRNCDFINDNKFFNCGLINTVFENVFFDYRVFYNSRFDETTEFNSIKESIINIPKADVKFEKKFYFELYKGIKEGYSNGICVDNERKYYQLEMKAKTRYNSKNIWDKSIRYFLEIFSGYGQKPLLVLRNIFIIFALFTVFFILRFNFFDGLILSAGAFFTFGAQADLLKGHDILDVIYIIEAFIGISTIAFFITVLYNYFFGRR